MQVAQNADINAGLPAVAPRKWFIFNDGHSEIQLSLGVLQMDNGDDVELCEWAETAEIGDVYRTGGATGEQTVTCVQ